MAIFRALSDADLQEHCVTPGGAPITVSKWLRLMAEHEIHHRGQIYMGARDPGRADAAALRPDLRRGARAQRRVSAHEGARRVSAHEGARE